MLHTPDGFENRRRNAGTTSRPTPKFASAFDDPKRSKLTSNGPPLHPPRIPTPVLPKPQPGPSKESTVRLMRQLPMPAVPHAPEAGPSKAGPYKQIASHDTPSLHLKPPAFASPSTGSPGTKFTLKDTLATSCRARSPSKKPVSKVKLKPVLPPIPPVSDPVKPVRSLNAMLPPPPPLPKKGPAQPDTSKLKTISTTRVAVALDPLTESGADELLALHLEQNVSTYVTPLERELNRGLFQSPEKASKSKSTKFIR